MANPDAYKYSILNELELNQFIDASTECLNDKAKM